ncbi:MAG: hypothetical protein ACYDAE_25290 [Steroidobacteraceae bacterium]
MSHSSELTEAAEHLDVALEHHAAGRHSSVKRRVELARACIERALEAAAAANPTKQTGAQGSDGQVTGESAEPRGFMASVTRATYATRAAADEDLVTRLVRRGGSR